MKLFQNQKYTEKKTFIKNDILNFSNLIGDYNPLHIDEDYAKKTIFGGTIVHGMLVASYFSKIIGMDLPGGGAIYLGQNLTFVNPIKPNELLVYEVVVTNIRNDKPIVTLDTKCFNSEGITLIEGEAIVKIKGNENDNT